MKLLAVDTIPKHRLLKDRIGVKAAVEKIKATPAPELTRIKRQIKAFEALRRTRPFPVAGDLPGR